MQQFAANMQHVAGETLCLMTAGGCQVAEPVISIYRFAQFRYIENNL